MSLKWPIIFLCFLLFIACDSKEQSESSKNPGNRLAKASSPYLQEHSDNPIDWYEWGPEALEKAKREKKPIVISVGYAACHWCHVMEEESFMDTAVAAIMNKEFISIKVDREERPDIDKVYMDAAVLLNGSGGWPLNVIALPDGRPFFAGTYYPKEQWKKLLKQVAETYKQDKEGIVRTADALTKGIRKGNSLDSLKAENTELTSKENYLALRNSWKEKLDPYKGGYKGDQKFPLPLSWEALLQYHYLTGDEEILEIVNTTLTNMGKGAIYDQLGGGFSRYTTDSNWLVPHFEKMLYDNAQLISLYSQAYKLTENREYARIVRESIEFVERELYNGKGGYYSSINADSNGEEGKYYVWSAQEINKVLNSEEARLFKDFYNIESYGNWEAGKNILYRNYSEKEYAKEENLEYSEVKKILTESRNKLRLVRENRTKPTVDRKVITSWNALMLKAYLDAFTALGDNQYLERAEETADFLTEKMTGADYSVMRSYMEGKSRTPGFLDDYSYLSNALIKLYQINFKDRWLKQADSIVQYAITHFGDNQTGMFYYAPNNINELITRQFEMDDNVLPSSNSVMAINLFVLGELKASKEYSARSEEMMQRVLNQLKKYPSNYANWSRLLGYKAFGVNEVAIVGEDAFEKNIMFQKKYYPTAIFMGGKSESLPLLKGKLITGSTLIYVCENKTCKYPVADVGAAQNMLSEYKSDYSGILDLN
ncbi:thioredoxin domain-containing protein [Christiangramia crocea]|uniref:Thioredoxin domain-containing protein n=1 Tax=Christiangramia crocea TaxID=2904124 RepID=A0A9X1UX95_9FLAO|nr:thioredoxin domain-containing protein [Gramella crocea]MCG9971978.1 thioredoxin domain-containing protein [Gramella crocea]